MLEDTSQDGLQSAKYLKKGKPSSKPKNGTVPEESKQTPSNGTNNLGTAVCEIEDDEVMETTIDAL